MGVLEQIINLKKQGKVDKEIIDDLSQKGMSPKEINEGLKQSQIKMAVSDFNDELEPSINIDEEIPIPNKKKESPEEFSGKASKQTQGYIQKENQRPYAPQMQQFQQEQYPMEQYPQEQYIEEGFQQEQYPMEQYPFQERSYQQNYSMAENNTDNIIEIADQIFSDRIRKFQKQLDNNTDNLSLMQTRIENMSERLKKIETIIDKLQIAILEKVGSYGQNLESVKKEMSMMQDSFSKMISESNKIIDEKEDIRESLKNIAKR